MKFRIKLLMFFIPVIFISGTIHCQVAPTAVKWMEGKKYIPYKIRAKDTWTNVAARNETSIEQLQKINKGINDLKIGQIIYLPAKIEKASTQVSPLDEGPKPIIKKDNLRYHTVKKGETLFHISQVYHQSIANIMKWNNLTSNSIPLGAELIVGNDNDISKDDNQKKTGEINKEKNIKEVAPQKEVKKSVTPEPVKTPAEQPLEHTDKNEMKADKPEIKNADSLNGYSDKDQAGAVNKITETGVATWLNDQELNQNKFYALHRTAPIGTIIKVTNRMNNNSVFVKVVGLLPATGENENIIIKITAAAAQRIGAIDQKFTAELSYGIAH